MKPMKNMTDRDAVWLGILRRDYSFKGKTPGEIRRILRADGFPQRLITKYLAEQAPK